MSHKLSRNYRISDHQLIETSSALHQLFLNHIIDFQNFDFQLNNDFAEAWLLKIKNCLNVVKDHQVLNIQTQKTIEIKKVVNLCVSKYNEVRYFAKIAFSNNKTNLSEFGTDFQIVRKNKSKLIVFMDQMHKVCLKHQVILIEKGLTLDKINAIETLKNELLNTNTIQENFKKNRLVQTEDRINILNDCYSDSIRIANVAQIVYANDFARKNQFIFNSKIKKTDF